MGQDDATTGRLRSVGGAALVDHVYALMGTARDGLHGSVTAAYVVGSIANGDDRGPLTDLDLLLVTDRRLDPDVLRATGERLADLAVGSPLRGVEAVLYRHSVLASPTYPLPYELNVNGGPAIARLVATSGTDGFWFLLDVAAAREHALALQGPPAAALIGPVPDAPVVKAVRESLGWHRRKGGDGADVVLNACPRLALAGAPPVVVEDRGRRVGAGASVRPGARRAGCRGAPGAARHPARRGRRAAVRRCRAAPGRRAVPATAPARTRARDLRRHGLLVDLTPCRQSIAGSQCEQ
jgi:hypothetical protein